MFKNFPMIPSIRLSEWMRSPTNCLAKQGNLNISLNQYVSDCGQKMTVRICLVENQKKICYFKDAIAEHKRLCENQSSKRHVMTEIYYKGGLFMTLTKKAKRWTAIISLCLIMLMLVSTAMAADEKKVSARSTTLAEFSFTVWGTEDPGNIKDKSVAQEKLTSSTRAYVWFKTWECNANYAPLYYLCMGSGTNVATPKNTVISAGTERPAFLSGYNQQGKMFNLWLEAYPGSTGDVHTTGYWLPDQQ